MKKEQSLRRSSEFDRLYREGLRVRRGGFVFYFLKTNNLLWHLGAVASRKTGCAVFRNRFRRRIRCLYPLLQGKTEGPYDAVVIATSRQAVMSSFSQLRELFSKALETLPCIEHDERVST